VYDEVRGAPKIDPSCWVVVRFTGGAAAAGGAVLQPAVMVTASANPPRVRHETWEVFMTGDEKVLGVGRGGAVSDSSLLLVAANEVNDQQDGERNSQEPQHRVAQLGLFVPVLQCFDHRSLHGRMSGFVVFDWISSALL
jgi:hypothetical protein